MKRIVERDSRQAQIENNNLLCKMPSSKDKQELSGSINTLSTVFKCLETLATFLMTVTDS